MGGIPHFDDWFEEHKRGRMSNEYSKIPLPPPPTHQNHRAHPPPPSLPHIPYTFPRRFYITGQRSVQVARICKKIPGLVLLQPLMNASFSAIFSHRLMRKFLALGMPGRKTCARTTQTFVTCMALFQDFGRAISMHRSIDCVACPSYICFLQSVQAGVMSVPIAEELLIYMRMVLRRSQIRLFMPAYSHPVSHVG